MLDLEISAREVAAQLKSGEPGPILLDVREPWEFATAQIAGSKPMPMGEVGPRGTYCHHLPCRRPLPQRRVMATQPGL
jgi:hypothetical protein